MSPADAEHLLPGRDPRRLGSLDGAMILAHNSGMALGAVHGTRLAGSPPGPPKWPFSSSPSFAVPVAPVTADNVKPSPIDSGFHTADAVKSCR